MDVAIKGQNNNRTISFVLTDDPVKEVLRVERDGRFFVDGQEIETSEQVRDIFARWCCQMAGGQSLVDAAQKVVKVWHLEPLDLTRHFHNDVLWQLAQALDQLKEAVKPE